MRSKNEETFSLIENFINSFYTENKRSPSLREIEKGTAISRQTAQRYLKYMSQNGKLKYSGYDGIITPYIDYTTSVKTLQLPIRGRIVCGSPEETEECIEGYVDIPLSFLGKGEFFALRAYGDSMKNAEISEGDLILVRCEKSAEAGQIVVAIDDEGKTTLKRLKFDNKKNRYFLHPENSDFQDLYPDEIRIQGVAFKVIKDLK